TNETHGIATGLIVRETDGMGLSTKGFRRFDSQKKPATRDDKSHLKCEECGMNRHTKDQCFKIISYPDWWTDGHKTTSNKGAKKDIPSTSPTANTRNSTKNSNDRRSEGGFRGVAAAVAEEGEESFSDIKTGQIIGRGSERDGLYYVDEVVQSGTVMLAHETTEREAWLWHRRLGHSSSYRDKLDPCAEKCIFVGYEYYYSPLHSGQGEEQGDPLSWLSYTSAATIGNEIQNHNTTSAEAPNINATPEHPVLDMISE
nr:ribonuclease H-like domain-containing protein [Tanacetum cinerariifolium]